MIHAGEEQSSRPILLGHTLRQIIPLLPYMLGQSVDQWHNLRELLSPAHTNYSLHHRQMCRCIQQESSALFKRRIKFAGKILSGMSAAIR